MTQKAEKFSLDFEPGALRQQLIDKGLIRPKKVEQSRSLEVMSREPWAILPDALETMISIAERTNLTPDAVAEKLGRPLDNTWSVTVRDGVAIVPIRGPIFRYANLFTMISGGTSTGILARDLRAAADDPTIKSILLQIDSPGGQATSIAETANIIRSISESKNVTAYVDGTGASAAYWLASAASEIVVSETALVGSIGTVLTVFRKRDSEAVEIVSSQSPKKRPDVDSEEGRAEFQRIVDDITTVFVESVAKFRGVTVETVLTKFGQGGIKVGAAAVEAGMADRVGSFEKTIAGLSGPSTQGGISMSEKTTPDKPEINREYLNQNHADLVKQIKQEGHEESFDAGAKAERERIQAVEAQLIPGHEDLINQLKFDGATTGDQAAAKVVQAEKQARTDTAQKRRNDAEPPAKPEATEETGSGAPKSFDEKCQAEWDKDANLREEFRNNFEQFKAWKKLEASKSA